LRKGVKHLHDAQIVSQESAVSDKDDFINATARPQLHPTIFSRLQRVVVNSWAITACFFGIALASAALFRFGGLHGWGIRPTYETAVGLAPPTFWECLYFSLVTISTLGYGDYRPESYSRVVACLEALAGIVLMGIFVSRLVSHQLERVTKSLLRGQSNAEIQKFRDELDDKIAALRDGSPLFEAARESALLYQTKGLVGSIARYWRHECKDHELAALIQTRAANRLVGDLIELLSVLVEATSGLAPSVVHRTDKARIGSITDSILAVAGLLKSSIGEDDGLAHSYEQTRLLVEQLRRQVNLRSSR
jgi:Ion channel